MSLAGDERRSAYRGANAKRSLAASERRRQAAAMRHCAQCGTLTAAAPLPAPCQCLDCWLKALPPSD